MRVLYCHDNIYQQCEDGVVYSPGQFPYEYWNVFLESFEHIAVTGRGVGLDDEIRKLNISSGPNVSFTLFPNINSLKGRLKYASSVNKRLEQAVKEADAVIIRAVSDIGWMAFKHAKRMKKPIAMEMAACAWDSTWNHGNQLGKIYAPIRYLRDQKITSEADYTIYVSQSFLQKRYPTNGQTTKASNVRIDAPDEKMIDKRLTAIKAKEIKLNKPSTIGLIGNLDNKIKGVKDTLIALSKVEKEKPGCFVFKHLGPGNAEPYKSLALELGIADRVYFDGMIQSGDAVLEWLKQIDLYLQPSYQEGVPRATIEAMSMACPVIASTAGGIPELLPSKWLIKPGETSKLAKLIIEMLDSSKCQYEAGLENYNKSLNYTSDVLMPKRQEFWNSFAKMVKTQKERNKKQK